MGRRDRSRSRSKSRSRDRSRSREKARSRSRDREDRGNARNRERDEYRRRNRSRSRSPVKSKRYDGRRWDVDDERDEKDSRRGKDDRDRREEPAKLKQKINTDQVRKERLALVKKLTRDVSSDEEDAEEDGEVDEIQLAHQADEEDMLKLFGFGGFTTTKGKQVVDNKATSAVGAVSKHKKRTYRQYMNRRGGFNRPLQMIK